VNDLLEDYWAAVDASGMTDEEAERYAEERAAIIEDDDRREASKEG
jgi:hypothetical protein